MRSPAINCRLLALLLAGATAVTGVLAASYARQAADAEREVGQQSEMNPVALSKWKLRDREYTFTVENYGYVYKGHTGELIDDCVITFGAWEKWMLFFLEDYVKAAGVEGTAFVDVGANSGQHTLFMAPRIKEVHAVEPFPPVLKRLHENVALNKFTNVVVHEVGFGDKEGSIPFYAPDEHNQGQGTFRQGDGEKKLFGNLRIAAGDEYFRGVKMAPVGILKVDIEGFEEPALVGLRQTMERDRPLVILEVTNPNRDSSGSIASFEQLKGLFPANYEFLMFDENQRQYIDGHYDIKDFAPAAEHFFRNEKQKNLIVVPAEKLAKLPRKRAAN